MNHQCLNSMRNFESEQNSTANFGMNSLSWIRLFCPDFDFIWPYFDLISLAPQLSPHWIYVSNSARNHWISSEFYSQIWVDFSTLKKTFQRDFDFIQTYFDLISLASQLFLLILWFIWDFYWFGRTSGEWPGHEGLFTTSTANLRVFIDAEWTGFLFFYIWFILIILFWFISLILLRFWSWQFDRSCQTGGVCCIKAVILTVCTVWRCHAGSCQRSPTLLLEPPKILAFRWIQQHTKSLHCNRNASTSAENRRANMAITTCGTSSTFKDGGGQSA